MALSIFNSLLCWKPKIIFTILLTLILASNPKTIPAGYAPYYVECPSKDYRIARNADSLSIKESLYIKSKQNIRAHSLRRFLHRLQIPGLDIDGAVGEDVKIGLAFSGGGFRAMFSGAGQIASMDYRYPPSLSKGHLGGLLQSSAYVSRLSGGSWLLGSIYFNGFATTVELRDSRYVWQMYLPDIMPYFTGRQASRADTRSDNDDDKELRSQMMKGYMRIGLDVLDKYKSGFPVSIIDFWGRGLSMEFFNATGEAHNQHWSDLSTFGFWNSNEVSAPFPIVLAVERVHYSRVQKGELDTFATYEFTPFELRTWNPPLSSFSGLKNIGTPVFNGTVLDRGEKSCVN
jgi:lysophospholipase